MKIPRFWLFSSPSASFGDSYTNSYVEKYILAIGEVLRVISLFSKYSFTSILHYTYLERVTILTTISRKDNIRRNRNSTYLVHSVHATPTLVITYRSRSVV